MTHDDDAAKFAAAIGLRRCRRCGGPTRPCPDCDGTGWRDGRECHTCDGWGRLYSPIDAAAERATLVADTQRERRKRRPTRGE